MSYKAAERGIKVSSFATQPVNKKIFQRHGFLRPNVYGIIAFAIALIFWKYWQLLWVADSWFLQCLERKVGRVVNSGSSSIEMTGACAWELDMICQLWTGLVPWDLKSSSSPVIKSRLPRSPYLAAMPVADTQRFCNTFGGLSFCWRVVCGKREGVSVAVISIVSYVWQIDVPLTLKSRNPITG